MSEIVVSQLSRFVLLVVIFNDACRRQAFCNNVHVTNCNNRFRVLVICNNAFRMLL